MLEIVKISQRKFSHNLNRTTVLNPCRKTCGPVLFNDIPGINFRPATLEKKKPPPKRCTYEYIRTLSASTGRSYMSSDFLIKLRVAYYALLTRSPTIDFFLKKNFFFPFTYFKKNLW